jgi:tripartite-type tricarboxylate transporter receptor subunit TctC
MNTNRTITATAAALPRLVLAATATLILSAAASDRLVAQSYPAKPVRMVVPFGAGGTPDLLARSVAEELSKRFGQRFIVDNRPGAGGNIGGGIVARSDADGYQLLMASGSLLTINPSLYVQMGFDPAVAFAPVSLVADMPNVLVVSPRYAAKNVRELIDVAKRDRGKLFFSSPGNGTSPHLTLELFQHAVAAKIQHVAFKSGGESVMAVLSGEATGSFANLPLVLSQIRAGTLRALGVASASRISQLPEVPTISEAGLPGFESSAWFGLVAPARTPRAIVDRLNSRITEFLREPDVQTRFGELGVRLVGIAPDEFGAYIRRERAKWAEIICSANIKAD